MRISTNKNHIRKITLIVLSIILVILSIGFIVVIPPSRGNIGEYRNEKGEVMDNSIKEKSYVEIDGINIGTYILSKNKDNPVLLVCGGGPGIPQYLLEYLYPSVIMDYFTICYFDYRGTCRSYSSKIKEEEMTTERYLKDVYTLTDYLSDRFNKDKIYIMGHSFGTYIALNAVYEKPDDYVAYIAMSQIANQKGSEYIAYDYMKALCVQEKNNGLLRKLEKCNPKESEENYKTYFVSGIRDKAMHSLGVGTTRNMKSVITGIFFPSLRCTDLTIGERINIWKGKKISNNFVVTNSAIHFNAFESVQSVEIPIYFIAGKYDYTCAEPLQREYYEFIQSPKKEYFIFDNSAHSPLYEVKDVARLTLEKILQETVDQLIIEE